MSDSTSPSSTPRADMQDLPLDLALDGVLAPADVAPLPASELQPDEIARASAISAAEIQARAARAAAARPADPWSEAVLRRAEAAEEHARNLTVPPSDPRLSAAERAAEARERDPGPSPVPSGSSRNRPDGTAMETTALSADLASASLADTGSYTEISLTEGNDVHDIPEGAYRVNGLAGNDTIRAVAGTTGGDFFDGGAGNDSLAGADSDDIFVGGAGYDSIRGGGGLDTVDYSASAAMLAITLTTSTRTTATTRPTGGDATGDVLSSIENVVGTAFADLITGNQFDNALAGGGANDTLKGGAGHDAIHGDATDDSGADGGADLLDGGSGNDTLRAGGGADNVLGGYGDDALYGGAGDDLVSGGDGADTLDGGDGDDEMVGSLGNDVMFGSGGNDNLYSAIGNDVLHGGDGADALNAGDNDDSLAGDGGNDHLLAGGGADTLDGGEGDDIVDGGEGNDEVAGGDGADTLIGGGGADALVGGEGVDVADYSAAAAAVGVDLGANAGSGWAAGDTFSTIENLTGSSFGDVLAGDGADNVLVGGAGADTLIGQAGIDTADYSASAAAVSLVFTATPEDPTAAGSGTGGDAEGDALLLIERALGSAFADSFTGGGLNNIFAGGLGADTMNGGGGTDTADYSFSTIGMTVNLADGTASDGDQLADMENVIGSGLNDTLFGNAVANRLEGGAGDDWMRGGAGGDILFGGAGRDTADYTSSAVGVLVQLRDNPDPNVNLGIGANNGAAGSDAAGDLLSQIENVTGSNAADDLRGSTIGNRLVSNLGSDILRGGSGADLLVSNGINGPGGFKQLIGEGIGDGGSAGLDTYRIIGTGSTPGTQLNLITNYQLGENIEVSSLTGRGVGNLVLGATTYKTVVFQSTIADLAHDTRILVGVVTADPAQQQAIHNQAVALYNAILANDADGPDLVYRPGLAVDDPWG